jgi:hypothetical protein
MRQSDCQGFGVRAREDVAREMGRALGESYCGRAAKALTLVARWAWMAGAGGGATHGDSRRRGRDIRKEDGEGRER